MSDDEGKLRVLDALWRVRERSEGWVYVEELRTAVERESTGVLRLTPDDVQRLLSGLVRHELVERRAAGKPHAEVSRPAWRITLAGIEARARRRAGRRRPR